MKYSWQLTGLDHRSIEAKKRKKGSLNLSMSPFSKVILLTTKWYKEFRAAQKPSISKVVFAGGDGEFMDMGVMVNCCIGSQSFPAAEDVCEFHLKVATD